MNLGGMLFHGSSTWCLARAVKARMFQARIKLRNLLPTLGGAAVTGTARHSLGVLASAASGDPVVGSFRVA